MVSPSSIFATTIPPTQDNNLTGKNEEPHRLMMLTGGSGCSCPCTCLPNNGTGEITSASPSSHSPLSSPREKDNAKISWLRRSDRLHDQPKPLGSQSHKQRHHHQDSITISPSSSRLRRGIYGRKGGNGHINGSSVPESHSEMSAPLRHEHVYPSDQLEEAPLEQVSGNDVDEMDGEAMMMEEQVVEDLENSPEFVCTTMHGKCREVSPSPTGPSCPSPCHDREDGSTKGKVPLPNRFSSELDLDCYCFPSSLCDCNCLADCDHGGRDERVLRNKRFCRENFHEEGESPGTGNSRESGGSGGGSYSFDFNEFKNRCRGVDADIDKEQVNLNYTFDDEDGETGEMRTVNMIRKLGEGGGGVRVRLFKEQRYLWLTCAFLLFLSVLNSANALSTLDDDDEDEFGGVSPYTILSRSRRSAESFSILNDALSLIPSNYSIHEPPPTNNSEATQVDFSVLIMNVRDIKELNEGYGDLELSLEMNLRIYWKDTRLSHLADRSGNKFIVLNPVLLDKIWHPDIFIDHVKGVAQPALISKPASLRIYPDSSVRYSARITVTMACQMDFHYYPADTQRCDVDMKSYAYSSKILALDWREGKGALLVEYLELPNFDVALDTTQNFMVNTSSGSYSGIRFTILLRRKLSYHLIQTYLPSTLFIIVSWLSFLVPPESVPGRMALCMTTLLTLTAMFSAVRQNTPNVSYVKALDIWMVVCIIFVFLTLVEYTVLLKLRSKKPKPKPPSSHTDAVPHSAQQQQQQQPQQTVTRWTIPSLQYNADDAPNFKFRGCKSVEVVINENGRTAEMRHRENGNGHGEPNDAGGGGDHGNNVPPPPPPPPAQPPPPAPPMNPGERPLNKYELAAKKIEKFTSAVIPTLFVIFNFIYWPWLIESADYYNHDKTTTIFKSM